MKYILLLLICGVFAITGCVTAAESNQTKPRKQYNRNQRRKKKAP